MLAASPKTSQLGRPGGGEWASGFRRIFENLRSPWPKNGYENASVAFLPFPWFDFSVSCVFAIAPYARHLLNDYYIYDNKNKIEIVG